MKARRVNNIIVVSDLHMICRLGLCPPPKVHRVALDDGGYYVPSRLQRVVWGWWEEFWRQWVPTVTRGEPFAVVINGDGVDGGDHHQNTTHISANKEDQELLALAVLRPLVDLCGGRFYYVRGTEAHGGKSGCDEEGIARQLGAVPDRDGRHARWRLRLRIGAEGFLVDIAHHIGTTGTMAFETSAILKELEQSWVEAARWGHAEPRVVVRSHRHRNAEARVPCRGGFATSLTTPGWQLKTPYAFRVPGARQARPQIGGVLIRAGDEDCYTRPKVWDIEDVAVEDVVPAKGRRTASRRD